MRKFLIVAGLFLLSSPALAQNTQCANKPASDDSNACANTRFVHDHIPAIVPPGSITLPDANIIVGNSLNVGEAHPVTAAGDCTTTFSNTGQFTYTCTKTNGVAFAPSATTDTTNASNISSGTLNTARLPSPFTNGTASGNTSVFGTVNGSLVNGNCIQADANGNLVNAGTTCGGSVTSPGQSGRLNYVNATTIAFVPFNGDLIKINGTILSIPSAGIAGCGNTGVYVGGVAGQNLAASTFYYVYAFSNSGTVTCDFRTGGHSASTTVGNVGTEILTGDNTRSLIGMVRTDGSSQFVFSTASKLVSSWFNRRLTGTIAAFTANRSTSSTTYVELSTEIRNEFLIWADDAVQLNFSGAGSNATVNRFVQTSFGIDSTTVAEDTYDSQQNASAGQLVGIAATMTKAGLSEGYHYVTLLGTVSSVGTPGTATWNGSATPGQRTSLSTMYRN